MQSNPGGTGTNDRTTGRHRLRRRLRLGGFVVALAVAIYLISGFFDVFELVHSWSRKYEGADVDELIVVAAFSPALILLYFLLLERGGRLSYFGGRRIRTEIITATPHLVAITNEDGGLVYLNPAGRRLSILRIEHARSAL